MYNILAALRHWCVLAAYNIRFCARLAGRCAAPAAAISQLQFGARRNTDRLLFVTLYFITLIGGGYRAGR